MGDYHVHLHPHGPRRPGDPAPGEFPPGLIERYVERAAAQGMEEVCFTEHLYRLHEAGPVLGEFWTEEPGHVATVARDGVLEERDISLDDYVTAVVAARDRGLPVLLGLEVDFFPDTIEAVLDLLEPYPWDLLLGSVHWIGGFPIDEEALIPEFEGRGVEAVYDSYYELEAELAGSGAVDVLAHVDVVKNHGHRLPEEPTAHYRDVAAAAASSGTAVEVSTAGLSEPCAEIYPSAQFLDVLFAAGVDITLASDTHRPQGTAWCFDKAISAARAAGYSHRCEFRRRRRTMVPLPRG